MKYVYMVRVGSSNYKVGIASNIKKRISGIQTSNARKVEVVTSIVCENVLEIERKLHDHLSSLRTDGGKEWFKLNPKQAIDLAVYINTFEDDKARLELDEKAVLSELLLSNKVWKKSLEKKLDIITNVYQKGLIRHANARLQHTRQDTVNGKDIVADDNYITNEARKVCWEANKASASLLQYKLKVGYARAARIMQALEDEGFVSKADGARPRKVLQEPT